MSGRILTDMEREQRCAAAADWLLRLRDPAISPDEIAEWLAWCDADAGNKRTFARMQALWQESGALQEREIEPAAMSADRYAAEVSVREWLSVGQSQKNLSRQETAGRSFLHRRSFVAAAASVMLAVVAATAFLSRSGTDQATRDITIAATAGINRAVVLPDGTSVTVAGGSKLATRYSAAERRVFLESGEAFFRVKPDPLRPFVVQASDATVTAVGTAFNVRSEAGLVRVAVTEGVVDVDRPESRSTGSAGLKTASAGNIRLKAGHQVTFNDDSPSPIVVSVDAERAAAWVTGALQFVDEPLSSVLASVNRYSNIPIVLADSRLGDLRFTGTVVSGRINEWLRGLPNVFPVEVRAESGARVLIVPASTTLEMR